MTETPSDPARGSVAKAAPEAPDALTLEERLLVELWEAVEDTCSREQVDKIQRLLGWQLLVPTVLGLQGKRERSTKRPLFEDPGQVANALWAEYVRVDDWCTRQADDQHSAWCAIRCCATRLGVYPEFVANEKGQEASR